MCVLAIFHEHKRKASPFGVPFQEENSVISRSIPNYPRDDLHTGLLLHSSQIFKSSSWPGQLGKSLIDPMYLSFISCLCNTIRFLHPFSILPYFFKKYVDKRLVDRAFANHFEDFS